MPARGVRLGMLVIIAQTCGALHAQSRICAGCHADIWETYRRTGMARSFSKPSQVGAAVYDHRASESSFAMVERGGRSFQQQYQIGSDGKQTNLTEKSVDFVLGSGNHARAFLHRTPRGELIELPLAWYAENGGSWAMNPGYDRPDHEGFRRRIGYDCMFCHNAYPQIPGGSGPRSAAVYLSIPEGIDCQRCHGSGAQHIALATAKARLDEIRAAIVNPKRLSTDRQMEVCMQCHLETTSSPLPNAIVKYDRAPFSYRPGEPLADYVLHFDRASNDDRFEINSSAYGLRQSQCFLKGRVTCTTCHNPHDVPRGEQALAHYNSVCRQCHTQPHAAAGNCVGCHMPKRRTDDVVYAAVTDHFIQRRPLHDLSPKAEQRAPKYRGEVVPYDAQPVDELYLAVAQVAEGSNLKAGIARLSAAIEKDRPKQAESYLQLGDALAADGRSAGAISVYEEALRREPGSAAARNRLALALSALKQYARAETLLDRSSNDAAVWTQFGAVYLGEGHRAGAIAAFEKAIRLDPDLAEGYNSLGAVLEDPARAESAFRTAIRLQPNYAEAHDNLANFLSAAGRFDEARLHFEAALRFKDNYAGARYDYALALSKVRRFDQAETQLETLLRTDPDHFDAHELLGNVLGAKGRIKEAIVHFREAVRIRPDSARANLDLGAALADSGDSDAARICLRKAASATDSAIREQAMQILRKLK